MSFILKEREQKRVNDRCKVQLEMVRFEAKRFGAMSADPDRSEEEFLSKIKAIKTRFAKLGSVDESANKVSDQLRNIDYKSQLPIAVFDTNLILELL